MNAKLSMFMLVAIVALVGMISPIDMAVAQSEAVPDGEGEDGNHEGKTCPFKERKSSSINTGLNIWFYKNDIYWFY